MNSNDFRYKLVIQQSTTSADSVGELVETFSDYKNVWARRENVKRSDEADRVGKDVYKFTFRYINGLSTDMRVTHRGETYRIVDILIGDRDRFMTITIDRIDDLS